ncbi:MAG: hypothetical protein LUQ38_10100, partial [Methanotrichaceae archaeon]|nr:hypothetical protein [Methanotrichaceae archaeon]
GRLQTERDKARILEGMESVSGQIDVKLFDKLISDLGKRQFILQSAYAKEPLVFISRMTMSYDAGPLDKNQISTLMAHNPARMLPTSATTSPVKLKAGVQERIEDESQVAPKVDASISVYYLDPAAPWASRVGAVPGGERWRAGLIARVHLSYEDRGAGIDHTEEWEAVFFPLSDRFDPGTAINVDYDDRDLMRQPPNQALYMLPDASLEKAAYFKDVRNSLRSHLSRSLSMHIFRNSAVHLFSRVGESRTDFEARCHEAAENAADAEVAKLRDRYNASFHQVKDQLTSADRRARELDADVHQRHQQELILGAGELLSGFLSGRRRSISLNRAASRRSQTIRSQERLRTAEDKKAEKTNELELLEDKLARDITEITEKWKFAVSQIEEVEISLDKTDVDVDDIGVLWIPIG